MPRIAPIVSGFSLLEIGRNLFRATLFFSLLPPRVTCMVRPLSGNAITTHILISDRSGLEFSHYVTGHEGQIVIVGFQCSFELGFFCNIITRFLVNDAFRSFSGYCFSFVLAHKPHPTCHFGLFWTFGIGKHLLSQTRGVVIFTLFDQDVTETFPFYLFYFILFFFIMLLLPCNNGFPLFRICIQQSWPVPKF